MSSRQVFTCIPIQGCTVSTGPFTVSNLKSPGQCLRVGINAFRLAKIRIQMAVLRALAGVQSQILPPSNLETAEAWNRRLKALLDSNPSAPAVSPQEYRIGPEDVLNINVFEAQELNREVRVSASGEISLPLLGSVRAAGLTPRELEFVLQELLHRTYMKDPHVSVFVREMQSHPVSVIGAVKRPGVFQIRGSKSLLEVLSLAEGLADDAGEPVIIFRGTALAAEPDPPID